MNVPSLPPGAPARPGTTAVSALASLLKGQAYGLGFDLAGIARLGPVESADHFAAWIDAGHAGEMAYLARGAEARRDTRLAVPASAAWTEARTPAVSALVVAMSYGGREPDGPVARYARGDDYHDVLLERLQTLHRWLEAQLGHAVPGKAYVDTGPLLERDLARRAGLGWFGKNTNLIHPRLGSFFFLGALLLGMELPPDAPFEADRCGTCTRCLDACPTDAFVGPRVLDATRCISYLTIEAKGPMPEALRAGIGGHVYGCDVCQDVCPWNVRFSQALRRRLAVRAAREALGEQGCADARARAARHVAGGVQRRVQGLADEAREAARAEAQRGRGARQRRHGGGRRRARRARSTTRSRSCASTPRGRSRGSRGWAPDRPSPHSYSASGEILTPPVGLDRGQAESRHAPEFGRVERGDRASGDECRRPRSGGRARRSASPRAASTAQIRAWVRASASPKGITGTLASTPSTNCARPLAD